MRFFIVNLVIISIMSGCNSRAKDQGDANQDKNSSIMNVIEKKERLISQDLLKKLEERKSSFNKTAPQEVIDAYEALIKEVGESNLIELAKKTNDKAPNFKLKNGLGHEKELYKMLGEKPIVLMWYRGGWCPYCNITLRQMQALLPVIDSCGASLVALTPELPDMSMSTKEKHDLKFEVLSDVNNKVAREYGLVFKLSQEVKDIYDNKFGLEPYYGNNDSELPLAATYVIDKLGTIQYHFLDTDYRRRANPEDIINALKNIYKR